MCQKQELLWIPNAGPHHNISNCLKNLLSLYATLFRYNIVLERTCRTINVSAFEAYATATASASSSQPFLNWRNKVITEYSRCFHTLGSLSWMSSGRVPEAHLCVSNCLLSRSLRQKAARQMLSGWRRRSLRSCARGNGAKRCCHLREWWAWWSTEELFSFVFPPARWGSLDLMTDFPAFSLLLLVLNR